MYRVIKRGLDAFFSGLAVVILTPFMLPVVLALRLTGEGEVFYQQKRVGQHRKLFGIWKFATMLKDSPNSGHRVAHRAARPAGDPGGQKYLRATKINELPQLLNVAHRRDELRGTAAADARRLRRVPAPRARGHHRRAAGHHRDRVDRVPRRGAPALQARRRRQARSTPTTSPRTRASSSAGTSSTSPSGPTFASWSSPPGSSPSPLPRRLAHLPRPPPRPDWLD